MIGRYSILRRTYIRTSRSNIIYLPLEICERRDELDFLSEKLDSSSKSMALARDHVIETCSFLVCYKSPRF